MLSRDDIFSKENSPFLPLTKALDESTYELIKKWSIGNLASYIVKYLSLLVEFPCALSEVEWKCVLWHWMGFLEGVIHAVHRCIPNMLPGPYASPNIASLDDINDQVIQEICQYVGIDIALCSDEFDPNFMLLTNRVKTFINASLTTKRVPSSEESRFPSAKCFFRGILNIRHLERYPLVKRPEMIQLPHVYTQFHSILTSMCPFEFPAVCLTCGAVIDAGGKGLCSLHASKCGADNSVFFLLQDCHILLSHHMRCSYFPAPYLDYHGERHRQVRGKPLHLDTNRFNSLYQLWLSHNIPQEVAHNRQNSTRIIIQGYY